MDGVELELVRVTPSTHINAILIGHRKSCPRMRKAGTVRGYFSSMFIYSIKSADPWQSYFHGGKRNPAFHTP